VHLFRPRLSFLAEAQPRLDNRRGQKALFGRVHKFFFWGPHYYIFAIQLLIYTICGDRTIIAIIICDLRRRIRHFFITFAVAIGYVYERSFSCSK
jgi:hypothetical protein